MNQTTRLLLASVTVLGLALGGARAAGADGSRNTFQMVRSPGIVTAGCLPHAGAKVTIRTTGPVETMNIRAEGLPPNIEFDFFVIQVPNAPFGVAWYLGDLNTNRKGVAEAKFIGRFSNLTFSVAPGTAPAPQVDGADGTQNPAFTPIHQQHLGLWFTSPVDATAAGCPGGTTPFNATHDAGVQVLNTSTFPDLDGPLDELPGQQ